MPKVQPVDEGVLEAVKAPVVKSRLKRLFERQFLRACSTEKVDVEEPCRGDKDVCDEMEPSSVCLSRMVLNFIEEREDKHGRNRCNCFNRNCSDGSEDENESCETDILKSLVQCASLCERNLLEDTVRIVEMNKSRKSKDDCCKKVVSDELIKLGYDASVCKSRWEKSPSFPAGEYEYIDVIVRGERLIIDIDFRSEFEIARATKAYKSVLQTLPYILVSKPDRLKRIIAIVSEAAKQSLRKKGMHIPPWRKVDYVKGKWFSPYTRIALPLTTEQSTSTASLNGQIKHPSIKPCESLNGGTSRNTNSMDDFELDSLFGISESSGKDEAEPWIVIKPESSPFVKKPQAGGLASVMKSEP